MSVFEILYIVSVSLQLSGSLLLLMFCFVNINRGIIENEKRENHVEKDAVILGRTQPTSSEFSKNVWLSRIVFFQLTIGYLMSIWGKLDENNRLRALGLVIVLTVVMVLLSRLIATRISKNK